MASAANQPCPSYLFRRRDFFAHCGRLGALLCGIASLPVAAFAEGTLVLDVPYVPTPQQVVDRMLKMAEVKPTDFVMDAGCGDGRMIITAAGVYKARGLGIDLNPERISEAKRNAEAAGVTDRVEFRVGNLYDADFAPADVITMYLLPRVNLELRPKILAASKPGTRVVSHAFSMGDWRPDRLETMDGTSVYLWVVPAQVDGRWHVSQGKDGEAFDLDLKQSFQDFSGTAMLKGRTVPIRDGKLDGSDIRFAIETEPGQTRTFHGRVNGQAIEVSGDSGPAWLATRETH